MAANNPANKKKKKTNSGLINGMPAPIYRASQRNAAGLGYTAADFGILKYDTNLKNVPGGTAPGTLTFSPTGAPAGKPSPTNLGTVTGTTTAPTAYGQLPNVVGRNMPASAVLTPAQQAQVKQVLNQPGEAEAASGFVNGAKSFLSRMFDYEDSYGANYQPGVAGQAPDNPVEAVWDGMLKGLGWGYDTLNHLTTAAISVAPGGIDTLTWEESQDVSVGQALVANAGVSVGKIARGEGSFGDILQTAFSPFQTLGGFIAEGVDPQTGIRSEGWDITNPEDRKIFESGWERFFSGVGDTAFTLFGDPLIIGGKFASIARIKYVDRIVDTEEARVLLRQELAQGAPGVRETAREVMSPRAMFVEWAIGTDARGVRRTAAEIARHPVINRAAMKEQIASALASADDYETGALLLRYAYGDASAKTELFAKRADLLDGMNQAEQNRLAMLLALNPARKGLLEEVVQNSITKAETRIKALEKAGKTDTVEWQLASRAKANAEDNLERLRSGNFDPIGDPTPENVALARKVMQDRIRHDQALAKAIGDEREKISGIGSLLNASTKGFAVNNRLGRTIERRRQRGATAGYETAVTRGRLYETGKVITRPDGSTAIEMRQTRPWRKSWWEADEFGRNGLTRTVRLWRWLGEENPSGFIITKGLGAQESSREVQAVLDDLKIYSGAARQITLADGRVIEVGGLDRKQQLLGMYMDAVNDTTAGADNAAMALERLERAITYDITSWHGISKKIADDIIAKADNVRNKNLDSLRDPQRRFFIDEDGTANMVPWLESQIQNGTYMHNYKALEKAARLWDESGYAKFVDEATTFGSKTIGAGFEVFNDFWRPLVLMRLGYTQRNVLEGWFRAAAVQGSFKPVVYGLWNGAYSARNALVKFSGKGAVKQAVVAARLREAGNSGVPMPKKYTKWLEAQIVAREDNIANEFGYMDFIGLELATLSKEYRDEVVKYLGFRENYALDRMVAAKNAGADADEIGAWQAMIDDADVKLKELQKIKFPKKKELLSEDAETAMDIWRYHKQLLDDSISRRAILDNEMESVALFAQQGRAKQRIYQNTLDGPDGLVLRAAFDENSNFTPAALSLLSSDTTTKSIMSLKIEGANRMFRATKRQQYQEIAPGQENYWNSLASMIGQIKNSALGKRIVAGESDDDIVKFLMTDPDGREIMSFVMSSTPGKAKYGWDAEDALEHVILARQNYERLVPTPDAQEFVRAAVIDETWDGTGLKVLLDNKPGVQLSPVVGTIDEVFGVKSAMDAWRSFTGLGMKWLGTIPEDALVRAPFYGTRHEKVLKDLIRNLEDQVGPGGVSMRDVEALQRVAHARALKDTKDWLYTIDRRTNLGTYGEYVLPFVSATQNSVTTVGRIIWNKPWVAGLMIAAWNAPNKAGWEDEEGNILIPLPSDILPDGVEQALGIDNMRNLKIPKASLNVIVPETGFGFIPRPGPLVAAPASEIMKHGWFGMSVESPEILRGVLGGKENADAVWNAWKSYLFGENQGVSTSFASFDMLAPPVAQKLLQVINSDGNSQFAYWYNIQYRNEVANWMAGYRDDMPSRDEILNKTRGFYALRILANLTAITPPQYESMIDPLVDVVRQYDEKYGMDSARMFNQQFGPFLQMIGDWSNSKNISGMGAYADSVEASRKYGDIIAQVSPTLDRMGDLSALSILTMGDTASSLYDDSAYGWQFANTIPGVNRTFREMQKPEQAWVQSKINAGWTTYITKMDELDARLKQSGVTSYRYNPELKAEKDLLIQQMANNPLFYEWYQDYKEYGSSRTDSAITTMQAAVSNQQFMADHKESPIWQAAPQYLYHRQVVLDYLKGRTGGINASENEDIRQYWDDARAYLNQNPDWAAFSNRFLNGDEDPTQTGVQMVDYYETGAA